MENQDIADSEKESKKAKKTWGEPSLTSLDLQTGFLLQPAETLSAAASSVVDNS